MAIALHSDLAADLSARLERGRIFRLPALRPLLRPVVAVVITMTYAGQLICLTGFPYLLLYLLHSAMPAWAWVAAVLVWTGLVVFALCRQVRFLLAIRRAQ